jgi:hypothetical protein
VWYTQFFKYSLRKHNVRIDLRVYTGDELEQPDINDLQAKVKSIASSAIIKGLDVVGVVSKFGIYVGQLAKKTAEENQIDIKVIPGQDYKSADGFNAVFYNVQQDIKPGLMIQQAATEAKRQGGRVMLYDLSRSHAKEIEKWKGQPFAPDLVEIYNAHSKAYKDLNINYPRVISSAASSGSELEDIPVYTEIPRTTLEKIGFLTQGEGGDYIPGYLRGIQ